MQIAGYCDPRFDAVKQAFQDNFVHHQEVGASLCVMLHGQPLVDLWGGVANVATGEPWREDTLVVVMSCTKGAVALCGHILADHGELDLNQRVAHYWPEFAAGGKSDITVRQVFSHQSGLVHVKGRVPVDGFSDWQTIIALIEDSSPFYRPGTRVGYHALTHGYLIGELVRRISGQSIGDFFRDHLASPLGLDFWLGLPDAQHHRVARVVAADPPQDVSGLTALLTKLPPPVLREVTRVLAPGNTQLRTLTNLGGFLERFDQPSYYRAENPSAGGITNGRGLASLYAPLAADGAVRGRRVISDRALAAIRYPVAATEKDAFLGGRSAYTLGFSKSWANTGDLNSVILGEDAFGTPGFGGNVGFADPHYGLSFGYAMNKQGGGTGLNIRGQRLVDEVYKVLGAPSKDFGFWARALRSGPSSVTGVDMSSKHNNRISEVNHD